VSADGSPVPLSEQDRSLWDSHLVAEGIGLVRTAAAEAGSGVFTIQAAIAALHAEAANFSDTDWPQILVLYRMLAQLDPSPVVALNAAIALGRVSGPEAGLRALDELADDPRLQRHRPFHTARAITLTDLGRPGEAEEAYAVALECPGNEAESEYIAARVGRPRSVTRAGRSWPAGLADARPRTKRSQAAKRMIASPDFTAAPASTSTSETVPE
jgi:RNA polymerase sigma-70 factor (ECF subfamily)